jgi:flagellar hook-associated protein 1
MGSLFASLNVASGALDALQRSVDTIQNNVTNASTPGYAQQSPVLEAQQFEPGTGLAGGVQNTGVTSARDEYAEQAVWRQSELLGNYNAQLPALQDIQSQFDINAQSGVGGALNGLFQSFSAWSASPSDSSSQQQVIAQAQNVALAFQDAANALSSTTSSVNQQLSSTVQQINALAQQIQQYNVQRSQLSEPDPNLDANVHAALESLSNLVDISAQFQADGTVDVRIGGQSALVLGDQVTTLQLQLSTPSMPPPVNSNAPPSAQIIGFDGQDITSSISQGQLGGLLTVRNQVLPSLQGDSQQQGSLNQLAQQVADRVNQVLTAADVTPGTNGVPLFTYDSSDPTNVAATLAVNPAATPSNLAAIDPGPPSVSNGAALQLANLGNSTDPADTIDGQSILSYYGGMAAEVGQETSNASNGQTQQTTLLSQAQAFRTQVSGVSLDQQATDIIELQRSYQAVAQMVNVIDTLTQSLLTMSEQAATA